MAHEAIKRTAVSRQVLADHVYEELFVALMDGDMEAGSPVSIDGMAKELGVSPTPVREALARLESTGMVVRVALKGYRVAPLLTPEQLDQLMEARRVIEPANAKLACENSTTALCEQLQQSINDLKNAPRGPSFATFRPYWEADEQFHTLIAEQAQNPFLLAAYRALGGQVQRFRYFGGHGVTDAEDAIAEHSGILAAFIARDPTRAARQMESHIANVRQRATIDISYRK